jgi:hypothetical protein
VQSAAHTFSVTASPASPATVASGGTTDLSASFSDSAGHSAASWLWDDGGAGGTFSPSATVAGPTYTAPANSSGSDLLVTLTAEATCDGPGPLTDSDSTALTVQPVVHTFDVYASVSPPEVGPSGTASLSASYTDSRSGHSAISWSWDDGGAGGTFSPSADVESPTYTAPGNPGSSDLLITLTANATCDGPDPEETSDAVVLTVTPAQAPAVLLEVHPNERAQGPGGAPRLGTAPWQPSGLGPGAWYEWKVYQFDGGENLWIQVCAQSFSTSQNPVGASDNLKMKIDGLIPSDLWGLMSGPPGIYQWMGSTDGGKRVTLEFQPVGLSAGLHALIFEADETPIIWWVKVYDLGSSAPE